VNGPCVRAAGAKEIVRPRRLSGASGRPSTSPLDCDAMGITTSKRSCCSSFASMCYWFAASLIARGLLSLVGLYWRPLG
jgi:hypothetical protein